MNTRILVQTAQALIDNDRNLLTTDENNPSSRPGNGRRGYRDEGTRRCEGAGRASWRSVTEGPDGLHERVAGYAAMGARFAKWRAVPAAAPGIAFLSGGQSAELASARPNEAKADRPLRVGIASWTPSDAAAGGQATHRAAACNLITAGERQVSRQTGLLPAEALGDRFGQLPSVDRNFRAAAASLEPTAD